MGTAEDLPGSVSAARGRGVVGARRGRRGPPLRVLIIATVLVPLVLLAGTLVALSGVTSLRISEKLGESILDGAAARVQGEVRHFLESAVRTSDLYARRIDSGLLPLEDLGAWERSELDDLVTDPDVASISFGAETGETTWVLRRADHLEVGRVDPSGRAVEHRIEPSGVVVPEPLRVYTYDPRSRPWYRVAVNEGRPVWTPVYFWFGEVGTELETGTGYARPVRDLTGSMRGVLIVDVTLGRLSAYLASLPLARTGGIYIVDHEGLVVAASWGRVNSEQGKRRALTELGNPFAHAAASALTAPQSEGVVRTRIGDDTAWVRVTPFRPYRGIDWRIVSVVPERSFLAGASEVQRRAGWVAALVVLAGIMTALLLGKRLTSPLLALAAHVRRVGGGDFESRIELHQARELGDLSAELNRMAAGLRERLSLQQSLALAEEVQQSLLPAGAPVVAGLDLAGRSWYSESTGGDYFDYLHGPAFGQGRVVVAVGDVMGHGVAAALLMATARAALRAYAGPEVPLGEMLARVNGMLAAHAGQGWFMTMALAVVDRRRRALRWASAGHNPPIVYDPGARRFLDLKGGGIPLGIEAGAAYEEHAVPDLPEAAVIVLATDGVWEARSPDGRMFGHERLRAVIEAHASETGGAILAAIEDALEAFCGGPLTRPVDDITAVVVRLGGV